MRGIVIRTWVSSRLPLQVRGRLYGVSARLKQDTVASRRRRLAEMLSERTGRVVQSGLFEGTVLPPPMAWGADDYAAMLLGTYELELHDSLRACIDVHPNAVINLGCASGLYAAGLARLLPGCSVVANDLAPAALAATSQAWELNRLSDTNPLELFHGVATFLGLSAWLEPHALPLVFCDIEGSERQLLDPVAVPQLLKALVVCEIHDHLAPGTSALLMQRFSQTHRITFIESGSRHPHALPLLAEVEEHDRWLAVSEGRRLCGHWLVAVPKSVRGSHSTPGSSG